MNLIEDLLTHSTYYTLLSSAHYTLNSHLPTISPGLVQFTVFASNTYKEFVYNLNERK